MPRNLDLSVYLVLDPEKCGGHQKAVKLAKEALLGGVTILQLRAPTWHKKALLDLSLDLLTLTREFNVPFLIDDHVDVAMASSTIFFAKIMNKFRRRWCSRWSTRSPTGNCSKINW